MTWRLCQCHSAFFRPRKIPRNKRHQEGVLAVSAGWPHFSQPARRPARESRERAAFEHWMYLPRRWRRLDTKQDRCISRGPAHPAHGDGARGRDFHCDASWTREACVRGQEPTARGFRYVSVAAGGLPSGSFHGPLNKSCWRRRRRSSGRPGVRINALIVSSAGPVIVQE